MQTLQDENQKLISLSEQLSDDKITASAKALIMEQMYEASDREKKELIVELMEQTQFLKVQLHEKEKVIHQLEKT